MATIIADLGKLKIPPHQLRKLGLTEDWNKNIRPEFVERVLEKAKRHRKALEELAKY